jgi:transcriptional regulator with XRE-family HTH domain
LQILILVKSQKYQQLNEEIKKMKNSNTIMEIIKNNILQKMSEQKLSKRSLSIKAHLGETAVNYIFKEDNYPRIDTIIKIADALECSFEELLNINFSISNKNNASSNITNNLLDEELYIETIAKLEKLLLERNIILQPEVKSKVSLAWYELSAISKNSEQTDQEELKTLNFIIKTTQR